MYVPFVLPEGVHARKTVVQLWLLNCGPSSNRLQFVKMMKDLLERINSAMGAMASVTRFEDKVIFGGGYDKFNEKYGWRIGAVLGIFAGIYFGYVSNGMLGATIGTFAGALVGALLVFLAIFLLPRVLVFVALSAIVILAVWIIFHIWRFIVPG